MNAAAFNQTIALGAITGMRSMAGPAALARRYGGFWQPLISVMAAAEMIADKTPAAPDRIDTLPLAGRAAIGALVGGFIAHEEGGSVLFGGLLGASTAVIAAHLAYRLRKQLPLPGAVSGMIEDAVVMGIASLAARRT
jgi:uncharacterized membrane protein